MSDLLITQSSKLPYLERIQGALVITLELNTLELFECKPTLLRYPILYLQIEQKEDNLQQKHKKTVRHLVFFHKECVLRQLLKQKYVP